MSINDFNINNGLMTKIWGPRAWFFANSVAFGYPVNPTSEQKQQYKTFFLHLGFVLPCGFCRESYQFFIKDGETEITDEVFENRDTLTKWIFKLHNRVNKKLGVEYGTTYQEFCDKFEMFRAKCVENVPNCQMPLTLKAEAFIKSDEKECTIIPLELAKKFYDYAEKKGIQMDKLEYYDNILKNKRNSSEFKERNTECCKIITSMRCNANCSLEGAGLDKDMPSINELKLISMLCTTLPIRDLENCALKLGYKKNRTYKLVGNNK
jgi:hypothetical protein